MSPAILEASAAVANAVSFSQHNLAALTEKLASLRYLIILTARWEASDSIDHDRRKVLSRDLQRLRREYFVLIDDIAMTHGVQNAMDVKDHVECTVVVPTGIKPPEYQAHEQGYSI